MIRFVLAFAIMAGPALAADCDTARQTVAPLTARREEANTRTKTYIEETETSLLCDPRFWQLENALIAALAAERPAAQSAAKACGADPDKQLLDFVDYKLGDANRNMSEARRLCKAPPP